jgi:hypothetical protein
MSEYIENVTLGTSKLDWAFPFQRTGAFPLDRSSLFSSYEDAILYATGGADSRGLSGSSYVGQSISIYNADTDTVTLYVIETDRSLKEVGSTPIGDNSSIEVIDGTIQLKNFGNGYYKYIPATENSEATYEYVEGFIEGLEPKVVAKVVDGVTKLELGWYEPNLADVDELAKKVDQVATQVSNKADKASVYTKQEVENLIAAADHLKRKKINSIYEIDLNAEDAEQYIYMVLVDSNVDGNDQYDEYMIFEGKLEKVGSWEVSLDDYVTKTALSTTLLDYSTTEEVNKELEEKVDKQEGYNLVEESEIEKLKTVKTNAEPNYIKIVSNDFTVSEAGKLELVPISASEIQDLQTLLDSKVDKQTSLFQGKETEWILLSPENQQKLASLVIGESGNVEISGKVNADNVEGLASWITSNRNDVTGLYPSIDQQKLADIQEGAEKNFIKSVDTEYLDVDANGHLTITKISASMIADLEDIQSGPFKEVSNDFQIIDNTLHLTKNYVETSIYAAEVGNLDELLHLATRKDGNPSTIVDEVNYINERLRWQELN